MLRILIAKPNISWRELYNVFRVMVSGNLAQGPVVKEFENEFSKLLENQFTVAVNSGTSGLHLALLSLGIGEDDEVLVPTFSFAASANAIALTRAVPVFVDIDPKTYNMDPKLLQDKITSKTRAILVVHLYGLPANMVEILKIARANNLLVIEDAAQAHLASINGKPVGTFGDAGVFSFYPTKNMTTGEGGIVTFKSEEPARKARLLRNQGMEIRYQNEIIGYNLRMTEIAAAIGLAQLKKITRWTHKRRQNAKFFDLNLLNVVTPYVPSGYQHSYHQYTIRVQEGNRDKLLKYLEQFGIGSSVYYPTEIHNLPAYAAKLQLPESELATKEVLSIPIHPKLRKKELKKIAEHINSFFEVK